MTPKEKAKELLEKLSMYFSENAPAKQCALIAVDEILNNKNGTLDYKSDIEYWQQVKQEINKL